MGRDGGAGRFAKALSVRAPWSELIASGRKTIELRSWSTTYRGPLLICSGVNWHPLGVDLHGKLGERGVTVARVELLDCRPIMETDAECACLPWEQVPSKFRAGFAWVLRGAERVESVATLGKLGLWEVAV
jgi:hypothetical protein